MLNYIIVFLPVEWPVSGWLMVECLMVLFAVCMTPFDGSTDDWFDMVSLLNRC